MLCWNKAPTLDVQSHMTILTNQAAIFHCRIAKLNIFKDFFKPILLNGYQSLCLILKDF